MGYFLVAIVVISLLIAYWKFFVFVLAVSVLILVVGWFFYRSRKLVMGSTDVFGNAPDVKQYFDDISQMEQTNKLEIEGRKGLTSLQLSSAKDIQDPVKFALNNYQGTKFRVVGLVQSVGSDLKIAVKPENFTPPLLLQIEFPWHWRYALVPLKVGEKVAILFRIEEHEYWSESYTDVGFTDSGEGRYVLESVKNHRGGTKFRTKGLSLTLIGNPPPA